MPQATIDAIGGGKVPTTLTDDERLLHGFCTEALHAKEITDATYAASLARFGEATLLDALCTVGYFGFVSVILNAIRASMPEASAELTPLDP